MNIEKRHIRFVAFFLLLVIAVPLIIQPGHYLFVKHVPFHNQLETSINQKNTHAVCAIDNFRFVEVTVHSFFANSQMTPVYKVLKISSKAVFHKQQAIISFSLRAPPIQ